MARTTILKNRLSYDDRRQLYYVTELAETGRRCKTFHTQGEAIAALYPGAAIHPASAPKGTPPPSGTCTLGNWLNWWLTEDVAASRAASTTYNYRNMARCHILPALADQPIRKLSPVQVQTYLYQKLCEGLSPNTVIKHYTLLFTALEQARRLELLDRNPMERVIPPRKEEAIHTFYSPAQLRILFCAVEGTLLELPVKLAAYLGLRRSEITGLRWKCVDLKNKVILIQEVRTEVGSREVVKLPKTKNSIRRLGIAGVKDLVQTLERAWQRRRSDDPEEYVLLLSNGTAPTPNYLTARMLETVRKHNLPHITLHGLRHSFASVANQQGVTMHDISRTLGHSSIAVTSSIYTHLFDDTESQTLQVVAKAIER